MVVMSSYLLKLSYTFLNMQVIYSFAKSIHYEPQWSSGESSLEPVRLEGTAKKGKRAVIVSCEFKQVE